MEENFLNYFQPYIYICQGLLREFFTKVPDRTFSNTMREIYYNQIIEGLPLNSTVKGIDIDIHRYQFGRMFEFPFHGVSYTYEGPIKFKKFKLSTTIIYFVINPMEDGKHSIKVSNLKANYLYCTLPNYEDASPKANKPRCYLYGRCSSSMALNSIVSNKLV